MEQIFLERLEDIGALVERKKFLLVRSRSYEQFQVKNILSKYEFVEFSNFRPNPTYEEVCEGVKTFCDNGCEVIVAVGGGSAIDVAKCIKIFSKMEKSNQYLRQHIKDTSIVLIAIPSTAGSGSESTRHAVIYYEGEKQSISHEGIRPEYVYLSSEILSSLPLYQKKCTMLDALSQAIESFWSINSTKLSRYFSLKSIDLIKENWEKYLYLSNEPVNSMIMQASNYAGRAIDITATTAPHAMSYKLTTLYKLPHGHAVSLCLPEVWDFISNNRYNTIDVRGKEYFLDMLFELDQHINVGYYRMMLKKMGMSYPISKYIEDDVEILVNSVNQTRLKNNPVALSKIDLEEMYRRVVDSWM